MPADDESPYVLRRGIPVDDRYDVVVAGGGPAGSSAAICAARLGAKVLLVEATGCLGGMGTSGMVTAFDPMANGEQNLVGGLMNEIVETMYKRDYLAPDVKPSTWRKNYHQWTRFRVEGYKRVLDELAVEAGVEVRFFTRAIDVGAFTDEGVVNGVVVHNVEGYQYVPAKTLVDATGDAVVADLCGVPCREAGRDTEGIMPATMPAVFGMDWSRREEMKAAFRPQLAQAREDRHFTQPEYHVVGMWKVGHNLGYLNGGHLFGMNPLRCADLTQGAMFGRRLAEEYLEFYRKYIPGCENIEPVVTSSLIGVRESRRIVGEYELGLDDFNARREFPDQIGVFNKFVDIHPYDPSKKTYDRHVELWKRSGRLKEGEYFGIPYGILVPQGWRNLWVAGRCTSTDVWVHGSIRVQPACSMMGQAAGTAAVQSINTGQSANELDTSQLVTTLREAGAYLPQPTLSASMTRSATANA